MGVAVKDKMNKLPLLLTASVATRGMKGAAFSDEEREKMYLEALKFYLEVLPKDQPIVFAENSGWPLEKFKELSNSTVHLKPSPSPTPRIEFISIDPSVCDQSRGKGYNEILLMNAVIEKSAAIREAGAFMKATGRYPIYNLPRYLKEAKKFFAKGGKFYGDMKDHKVFDVLFAGNTDKWNGHAAYTVLFATTVDFYKEKLAGSYVDCNDYTYQWIEVVWHRILSPYRKVKNSGVKLRLPVEPICGGMQGSTSQTIAFSQSNESVKAKLARFVGNCIRTFTPWFWF